MNSLQVKIFRAPAFLTIVLLSFSCNDLLEEKPISDRTTDNYYVDQQGFEDLVKSAYAPLRGIHKQRDLVLLGTDLFTQVGDPELGGLNGLNEYSPQGLNPQSGFLASYWSELYSAIGRTNTAVDRAAGVQMDDEIRAVWLAEAKFLRALYYFYLVEQFGDIPLMLNEVTEVLTAAERAPESAVYEQIVADLESAIASLPPTQEQYGRVTAGAAQHLLAKVLLTRGYKEYGSSTDFQDAASLASTVINAGTYRLLDTFEEVFEQGNEKNDEVIFSVQYSDVLVLNGSGSNAHSIFGVGVDGLTGAERSSVYNRQQPQYVPTKFLTSLYDVQHDSRYEATFERVFYATIDQDDVKAGDTILYFPPWDSPWSEEKINSKNFVAVNWEDYYMDVEKFNQFPPIWKFFEEGLPYGDDQGTRDQFIFRLAETYLLAAEAQLMAGNEAAALDMINAVRERAAIPGKESDMKLSTVTLDEILNERGRELCGEDARWNDLKRTGKLIERVMLYNERAAAANFIGAHHLLRPIPLTQIERTTNDFPQNPGYDQ